MNKKVEKMAVKAVVGMAVKAAKLPNQFCPFCFGKPWAQMDLAVSDYEKLESFMEQRN